MCVCVGGGGGGGGGEGEGGCDPSPDDHTFSIQSSAHLVSLLLHCRALQRNIVTERADNSLISNRIRSKHVKKLQRTLFIRTKDNMQIFAVIPFITLQNDT